MRDALETARTRRYRIGVIITSKQVRTAADVASIAAQVSAGGLVTLNGATFGLFDSVAADDSVAIASGAAVLTSANNPWVAGDVGKAIDVQGAGVAGATLRSRIKAFTNAGSVTLWDNASTNIVPSSTSTVGLAAWGNDLNLTKALPANLNEAGTSEMAKAIETILASNTPVGRSLSARFSDSLNVMDYGAIGNGIADDSAAIQLAINDAASLGKEVLIPAGSYYLASSLTLLSNVRVRGLGFYSVLYVANAIPAMTSAPTGTLTNCQVRNLYITNKAAALPSAGMRIYSPFNCVFEDIYVDGNSAIVAGFLFEIVHASYYNTFRKLKVTAATSRGFRVYVGAAPDGTFNQNHFVDCVSQTTGNALAIDNGKSNRFENCDFENYTTNIVIDAQITTFSGCWFEPGNASYLDFTATAYGCSVRDCRTRAGTVGSTSWGYRDLVIDRVLAENTGRAFDVQYAPVGWQEGNIRLKWINADRRLVINGANIALFNVCPPFEVVGYRFWVMQGDATVITDPNLQIGPSDSYTIGGATTTLGGVTQTLPLKATSYAAAGTLECGTWYQNAGYAARYNGDGHIIGAKFKTTQAINLIIALQLLVIE